MYDQLRWDYLSCYGHPHLHTPNFDAVAEMGVRFDRCYIQSPLCGPSRMSTYTGRYVHSHGATWNNVPLKVGERTMGDYLREAGMGCWLVGKTHMKADAEGLARLGIDVDSVIGARVSECGFDIFERDDGMRPEGPDGYYDKGGALKYNEYLRERGYGGDNPWHDHANSGIDDEGNVLSGWFYNNSTEPANIEEADSETPYLTRRGMEFMESMGDESWCCHLSFIKPHWPYIVPAPYHDMYGQQDFLPAVRSQAEYDNAHPVFRGMMNSPVGKALSRDEVRSKVLQAYMGLVKQCDDQLGVLLDWLRQTGRMENTMIVLTSDHGDFLGDHWLGEKTFFQDASTRVPLIIYDPDERANVTRGTVCEDLVESIDLLPTFLETAGGDVSGVDHILEGRSLVPVLHNSGDESPRTHVICEYDISPIPLAGKLGLEPDQAVMIMIASKKWKMIHFGGGFRPMLFNLENDPDELVDLAASEEHQNVIEDLYKHLLEWASRPSQRTTKSRKELVSMRGNSERKGILLGYADPDELPAEFTKHYTGRKATDRRVK